MKRVFSFLKPYTLQCILAPLFKLLEAGFELLVPLVVAAIVDKGIALGNDGYVWGMCGILAALALFGFVFAVTAQYFSAKAAIGFGSSLRFHLFDKIQHLSYRELDSLGTSQMVARLTGDVNQAQTGVNMFLRLLLRSPFVVFGAWLMASFVSPASTPIFGFTILALTVVIVGIMWITIPMYRKSQGKLDRVLALTRENMTGVRVIRAFGMEEREVDAFRTATHDHNTYIKRVGRLSGLTNPLTFGIVNMGIIFLMRFGGLSVQSGSLSQGEVIALYNYMAQILVELVKLANLIVTVTKALASAKRIEGVFQMESSLTYPQTPPEVSPTALAIAFENVTMSYHKGGDPAISGVTFAVPRGGTLGVIGATGSGKTTLVNLIPRFYDPEEGTVSVLGANVKDYPKDALREQIAVVPQSATLFRGSIRDNLKWGNPHATDAELEKALATAQALEVVGKKPKGLDEEVEAGGRNFSGGERQRLTIARALVRKPQILILDDSASALDYATDARLRHALKHDLGDMTVVTVSQRISAVRHADAILVLEDGVPAGFGSHAALLETCTPYREIYLSQEKGGNDR